MKKLVVKPLSFIESLMSSKANDFRKFPSCILEPGEKNWLG